MRGPAPKDPAFRQRRNKAATAATLPAGGTGRERAPALPRRRDEAGRFLEWHELTRRFWADVWASPMAAKFLEADVHGMYLLVDLLDRYWRGPTTALAAEIRQHRQAYGLTPIDRRRLQWALVEQPEEPKMAKRTVRRGSDPRALLRAVK